MNDVVPTGPKGWLAAVTDGNWLKMPGAVKAIGRLVTSVGDTGAAWIEVGGVKADQMKAQIRSDTKAQETISEALANAAKDMAVADSALVERSMRRWVGEEARKQENREGVAKKTIEELGEDPPTAGTDGPSDDWLNSFSAHAEKASSEEMRSLFGRVLAGEIRKPGSVSLMTLQFFSVLDAQAAAEIQELLPYVVNGAFIPKEASAAAGLLEGALINVESLSFGNYGSGLLQRVDGTDENKRLFLRSGAMGVVLTFDEVKSVLIPAFLLSPIGRQIASIIPSTSQLHTMAPHFWKLGPKQVQRGFTQDLPDGRTNYLFLQDVPNPDAPIEPAPETPAS